MSKPVTVKILHNTNVGKPYTNGDILEETLRFQSPFPACGHVKMLLQIIYRQLNGDNPAVDWAWQYHQQGHRSLSIGDVVIISERAWAVDPNGWREVIVHHHQIDDTAPAPRGIFRLGQRVG